MMISTKIKEKMKQIVFRDRLDLNILGAAPVPGNFWNCRALTVVNIQSVPGCKERILTRYFRLKFIITTDLRLATIY